MTSSRPSLVDAVIDDLLVRVASRQLPFDAPIPPEPELAEAAGVSRLTVREAVKVLRSQNVLVVRRGIGTFPQPVERWTSIDAVYRAVSRSADAAAVGRSLFEARSIVEVGACALAADRRSDADLERLESAIADGEAASAAGLVEDFVASDLDFHGVILRASSNPFVPALLSEISTLLYALRIRSSQLEENREHTLREHRRVLAALRSGDADAASAAMASHMRQGVADYEVVIARAE